MAKEKVLTNRTYWLAQIGFWLFYNALLWGAVIDGIAFKSWLSLVLTITPTCVLGTHLYHRTLTIRQIDISNWKKFIPCLMVSMLATATVITVFTMSIPVQSNAVENPFPVRTSMSFIFSVFFSVFFSCCPGFWVTT